MKTFAIFFSYLLCMIIKPYAVDQLADIDKSVLMLPVNITYSFCINGYATSSIATVVVFITSMLSCGVLMSVALILKSLFFRQATHSSVITFVSVALGVILGLLCMFLVPQFESMYEPFKLSLPLPTTWLLDYRYFLWAPLLLITISWRPLRLKAARTRYYLFVLLGEALLLSMTLVVLYVPFFKLGICV